MAQSENKQKTRGAGAASGLTERLARTSAHHPWRTIGVWVVLIALAVLAVSTLLGSGLTSDIKFRADKPDSLVGQELLEQRLTGPRQITDFVIVRSATSTVDDPAFKAYIDDLARRITGLGPSVVTGVSTYYETKDPTAISRDGHAMLIPVVMAGTLDDAVKNTARLHALVVAAQGRGFTVAQTGDASIMEMFTSLAEKDLARGEILGVPAALIVLLIVFGAVLAACMPLLLSIISIVLALALTALIGQVYPMTAFALNILTMMGLAVGIDYTLFVLSRYREERARGLAKNRRHRRDGRDRQSRHLLQRHDRGPGHGRHGHRPARHHDQHGRRRDARGLHHAGDGAHRAPGAAQPARRPRRRAAPADHRSPRHPAPQRPRRRLGAPLPQHHAPPRDLAHHRCRGVARRRRSRAHDEDRGQHRKRGPSPRQRVREAGLGHPGPGLHPGQSQSAAGRDRRAGGIPQGGADRAGPAGRHEGRWRLRPGPGHPERGRRPHAHHHDARRRPGRRGHPGRRQAAARRHRAAGRRDPRVQGLRHRQHRRASSTTSASSTPGCRSPWRSCSA